MIHQIAIEATCLRKLYEDRTVLDGISLTVRRGSVFALLGPNGAGKTTTVRILATLLAPDGGWARVAGRDVVAERREVRHRISLTGQYAAVDELQTGRENLTMIARLLHFQAGQAKARAAELLEHFDLGDAADRRVGTYSGGMRRRLDLAASLLGRPEVLFLDEPTTGLDPRSRQTTWQTVAELAASGITVFLTTQYLEEADCLADRIAVLHRGKIVAEGTAHELRQQVSGQRLDLQLVDAAAFHTVSRLLGARATHVDRERLSLGVPTDGTAADVRRLLDELDPQESRVARFALVQASLDDVFMALTDHHVDAGIETHNAR
jgi:ABC-2 type transport system ATP-binding protein